MVQAWQVFAELVAYVYSSNHGQSLELRNLSLTIKFVKPGAHGQFLKITLICMSIYVYVSVCPQGD